MIAFPDSKQAIFDSMNAIFYSESAFPDSSNSIPDSKAAISDSKIAIPDSSSSISDTLKREKKQIELEMGKETGDCFPFIYVCLRCLRGIWENNRGQASSFYE